MLTLSEATEAYQVMLEAHRAHPDHDGLYADLLKARAQMEWAWEWGLDGPQMVEDEHLTHAVLIGTDEEERTDNADHLSLGHLSAEAKHRWVCHDCITVHVKDARYVMRTPHVWVSAYRAGQGSSYALCHDHLLARLSDA